MKTIIIAWGSTAEGAPMAHFPEPFGMERAEWIAFANLFDGLGFAPEDGGDIRKTRIQNAPALLSDGLNFLGYAVEHRGVPPSLLPVS